MWGTEQVGVLRGIANKDHCPMSLTSQSMAWTGMKNEFLPPLPRMRTTSPSPSFPCIADSPSPISRPHDFLTLLIRLTSHVLDIDKDAVIRSKSGLCAGVTSCLAFRSGQNLQHGTWALFGLVSCSPATCMLLTKEMQDAVVIER